MLALASLIVNEQLKLIYLAVPRTASTSISRAILDAFPDSLKLGHHRMRIPTEYKQQDYFIFAGVRNPYARMVSHYLHRHRLYARSVGHWTFYEYVDHLVNDRLYLFGLNDDPPAAKWLEHTNYSSVLRFESLSQDWSALPPWESAGFIPLLHKRNANLIPSRNWQYMYTQEIADAVLNHQEADFQQFDYHPDSWKPKAKAGKGDA